MYRHIDVGISCSSFFLFVFAFLEVCVFKQRKDLKMG